MFNSTSIIQTRDLIVFTIYLLLLGLYIFSFDFFFPFVIRGKLTHLIIWMGFIIVNNIFVVSYCNIFTQENLMVEVELPSFSTLANLIFTY